MCSRKHSIAWDLQTSILFLCCVYVSGSVFHVVIFYVFVSQVKSFYSDVSSAQPVSEQELGQHMQQLSAAHAGHFDNMAALKELYIYVTKYHELVSDLPHLPSHLVPLDLSSHLPFHPIFYSRFPATLASTLTYFP